MIVACVTGVVAVAFYAVDEQRRNPAGGRRSDDVDSLIRGAHGLANAMARALGSEIFGCGDRHAHGYTAGHVGHVILVPLAKPAASRAR